MRQPLDVSDNSDLLGQGQWQELESRIRQSAQTPQWLQMHAELNPSGTPFTSGQQDLQLSLSSAVYAWRLVIEAGLPPVARDWVCGQTHPLGQPLLNRARELAEQGDWRTSAPVGGDNSLGNPSFKSVGEELVFCVERMLARKAPERRSRFGAYYTPRPIVECLVRSLDQQLREEFALEEGIGGLGQELTWADDGDSRASHLRVLDPASGTGTFACALLRLAIARFRDRVPLEAARTTTQLDDHVVDRLLPAITCYEPMLPAWVVGQLRIAWELFQAGFGFSRLGQVHSHWKDTLSGPGEDRLLYPLVLGNPPYSALSIHQGKWIQGLLRGQAAGESANYFEVEGKPIRERKHWLHDDYVKFIRFAHWQIERAGWGAVAFVTNHGFLDNPTFRGMRYQLGKTFPRITVLDCHGNRKRAENSGQTVERTVRDENVFGIEQGVCLFWMRRAPRENLPPAAVLDHGDIWGNRRSKLERLGTHQAAELCPTRLTPQGPHFLFRPIVQVKCQRYDHGIPVTELFVQQSTAPVTARDRFVVAMTRQELLERLGEFADLGIDDQTIRSKYFDRTRSSRYPMGDTRGWKLTAARQQVARHRDWSSWVRPIQYRPFDVRYICWTPLLIDWPRTEISQQLLMHDNPTLITRRQMLPGQPCNFFWATRLLTLDGILRSDNRGSESIFPLYAGKSSSDRRVNLSEDAINRFAAVLRRRWLPLQAAQLDTFNELQVFQYLYGLFFSPAYRERYASTLTLDFPRVILPATPSQFDAFVKLGARLLDLHTKHCPKYEGARPIDDDGKNHRSLVHAGPSMQVERGFPKFDGQAIRCHPERVVARASQATWEYRIGAHQVCLKWLKDRRGRPLTSDDLASYRSMVRVIDQTRSIENQMRTDPGLQLN